MNAEIKARWLPALRSGEYKQGKNFLKRDDGSFCCLGVLYDVEKQDWSQFEEYDDGLGATSNLPPDFGATCGLTNEQTYVLAQMNDNGHSFSSLADYIEANL